MYDLSTRSFKRQELTFDKLTFSYRNEKKSLEEKNKFENKSYTKLEKQDKFYVEEEKKKQYKENKYKESFNYMAQYIQALERKLSSFKNN